MIDDEVYSDSECILFLTFYEIYQIMCYVELFILSIILAILLIQI